MANSKEIKVFEAFSGYGGASFGLKKSKVPHKVIAHSECDMYADIIFSKNHPRVPNLGDITKIDVNKVPKFDLFTGGFPCQPFSSAGKGLGVLDIRGTLFYDIIRLCEHVQPKDILLENVKGITMGKHKETFQKILAELERIGYKVYWKVFNTKEFGIPQNRERLWIFATKFKYPKGWEFDLEKIKLKKYFKDILESNPDKSLFLNDKQIERLIEKHNVNFNIIEPACLDIYNKKVRTDGISITLTEPHHNSLRVVMPPKKDKFIVRKLSPLEHFRLMGFKDGEIDFAELSYSQICKRAGNGWDINVASKIFQHIYKR